MSWLVQGGFADQNTLRAVFCYQTLAPLAEWQDFKCLFANVLRLAILYYDLKVQNYLFPNFFSSALTNWVIIKATKRCDGQLQFI